MANNDIQTEPQDGVEPHVVSQSSESPPCSDEETATNLVIAYEPVWAIGTGRAASGAQVAATVGFVRDVLTRLWNQSMAQGVRILYGGSVTGANVGEFISHPEVDGALVGGASLKAGEFVEIVEKTAEIKGSAR